MTAYEAAEKGDLAELSAALDLEPRTIESFSTDGWTLLHLASYFGRLEAAQLLLDRGAAVEARSRNTMANQPLHAAAAGRKPELVRLLLAHGAPADSKQDGGFTPLHSAAQSGDLETIKLLLAAGANPQQLSDDQRTPVMLARDQGHQDALNLLLA